MVWYLWIDSFTLLRDAATLMSLPDTIRSQIVQNTESPVDALKKTPHLIATLQHDGPVNAVAFLTANNNADVCRVDDVKLRHFNV